jgi:hypothetical protein
MIIVEQLPDMYYPGQIRLRVTIPRYELAATWVMGLDGNMDL